MKSLMTVDEAKEDVETVAFGAPFSLTTPLGIKCEVKLKNLFYYKILKITIQTFPQNKQPYVSKLLF